MKASKSKQVSKRLIVFFIILAVSILASELLHESLHARIYEATGVSSHTILTVQGLETIPENQPERDLTVSELAQFNADSSYYAILIPAAFFCTLLGGIYLKLEGLVE